LSAKVAFGQGLPISQGNWTLHAVDSQELDIAGYAATNAFDGNPNTMWATQWANASPPAPHEIQINLGAVHTISGFRYLPRQDGAPQGRIAQYEFYVSMDGATWGPPVASGTLSNTPAEQPVGSLVKLGQYVRLRALTEVNAQPWTTVAELNVLATGTPPPISQANWTLWFVDSQEADVCCYAATNAFDGDPRTMWATQWSAASPPPPHEIQIDLGAVYDIRGFRYLPRQDAPQGRIGKAEFYVSMDGVTWNKPLARTFVNPAAEQEALFFAGPETGRYIRLRATTEVNGQPWTTVAELNVLASGNQPPNGTIGSPAGDVTIAPGQSVIFNGSGSDPDDDLPLTYAWNFGAGGPPASTSQNPGAVVFPNAGVYIVSLTARDAQGAADPTPATRIVTVQSTSSATMIPQAGWSVHFVDGEETNVPGYLAPNAFDGNPNTSWASPWFGGGPKPPHEMQIDLGAPYSVAGFRYLPHQPWQVGRVGDYEFYVSADGVTWGAPVAVGAFPDLNTADARDVMFVPKTGRYVRFRALTELHGRSFNALAELNVWREGTGGNQPPLASISTPAQDLTINTDNALTLSGAASDPDLNLPLTYRWSVGPGAGIPDITVLNAGLVQFNRPGTFTVTLTVTDSLGKSGTATRTVTVIPTRRPLPNNGWTLHFVDSEETAGGDNAATNAFDGDPATIWTSQWLAAQPPPPHVIQIDLGETRQVAGFRYLPRQDGYTIGNIGLFEFYVSQNGTNWTLVSKNSSPWAADSTEKGSSFSPRSARYVRLRAMTEVNGLPYTAVAELGLLEKQCPGPSVSVFPRSGRITISSIEAISAEVCLSQAGQGVKFVIDGQSVLYNYGGTPFTTPYQEFITFFDGAEHVIEAYLVDSSGNPVDGDATYDRSMPVAIRGDAYVALGDGITFGYGDDIPTDDNSADGRNLLGGYTPILADRLTTARGVPVGVRNAGVAGATSADGASTFTLFEDLLVMYGHGDAIAGTPSGLGLTPQSPGYAGSFKDHLQQIISRSRNFARNALLAKAPPLLPLNGPEDLLVQEYNMVVDELVAANAIPVAAPDFYTYFKTRTATHYSSAIELNGLGYQAMAELWLQAILGAP
jgi:lysophospholipase L1-like esterase